MLKAFAGMAQALGSHLEGGFLSGLPVYIFDAALLWTVARYIDTDLKTKPRNSTTTDSTAVCLPSWSWVGWHNTMDFSFWTGFRWSESGESLNTKEDGEMDHDQHVMGAFIKEDMVVPLVEWSSHESTDGPPFPLSSSWFKSRKIHMNQETSPLPEGWIRNEIDWHDIFDLEEHMGFNFSALWKHSRTFTKPVTTEPITTRPFTAEPDTIEPVTSEPVRKPVTSGYHYAYPRPIPAPSARQPVRNHPFISCRTRRACLSAIEATRSSPRKYGDPDREFNILLFGKGGEWAGVLDVYHDGQEFPACPAAHTQYHGRQLPNEPFSHRYHQQRFELVEVATGWIFRSAHYLPEMKLAKNVTGSKYFFPEENSQELEDAKRKEWIEKTAPSMGLWLPAPNNIYEYYWVFLIKWVDGVAYKQGMGRVFKHVWEAQDREWIDLMLG